MNSDGSSSPSRIIKAAQVEDVMGRPQDRPCSAGTLTLQEAPSFAWRTNARAEPRPRRHQSPETNTASPESPASAVRFRAVVGRSPRNVQGRRAAEPVTRSGPSDRAAPAGGGGSARDGVGAARLPHTRRGAGTEVPLGLVAIVRAAPELILSAVDAPPAA